MIEVKMKQKVDSTSHFERQGCGSGSIKDPLFFRIQIWIRYRITDPDPGTLNKFVDCWPWIIVFLTS